MIGTITGLLNYFAQQNNADAQRQLSQTYELLGQLQANTAITNAQLDVLYAEVAAGEKEKEKDVILGAQQARIGASGLTSDSYSALVKEAIYNANLDILSVRLQGQVSAYNKYMSANEALINAEIQSNNAQNAADTADINSLTSLISGITSDIQTGANLFGGA